MKKNLLLIYLLLLISFQLTAQSWQWALSAGSNPRSQAVTIKQDHDKNVYVASYTDSVSTRKSTQFEKRDIAQQIVWQKQIDGDATITDLEINAANHAVVAGYFLGTISVDGTILTSFSPTFNSGFIFETDETGTIQWVHDFNPVSGDFKTKDLFIAADGNMYLTSEVSGSFGFCAFHKLNAQGVLVKNEFNNNSENRTFTHILTDADDNVYLSGTCGNGATFDSISANAAFSYQNFLIKYDSSFKAQWFISHEYITFDDNNSLSTDGQNLYWAFNDFKLSMDTVKIIKCDHNGQILNTVNGPLDNAFFPAISYEADRSGNSVLVLNIYTHLYFYRYDNAFNITWQDTIYTSTSGFPFHQGLSCYDSSFYFSSYYLNDTLQFDNLMLLNPNTGANYPSDIFISKWSSQQSVSVNTIEEDNSVVLLPNPATSELNIENLKLKDGGMIKIFDAVGNLVYSEQVTSSTLKIQTLNFKKGVYFLQMMNKEHVSYAHMKFVKM